MDITKQARTVAEEVLESCVRKQGFYASGLPGGYEATWARDSMITALGAALCGNRFKETIANSLKLLAKNQAELGQIPNCVGSYNLDRRSRVTFNSLDSSLWFIIGHKVYAETFKDRSLLKKYKKHIDKALIWSRSQDPDNLGLVAQQPTMDWEDAFPHKYGYVIHNNSLFFAALRAMKKDRLAERVQSIMNGETRHYSSLYDNKLGYYYPWAWKNHDNIREHEEWFDSAGNLLAIISGMATEKIATKILSFIEKSGINQPYPCKAIWPPIKPGDPEWRPYFALCDAREPYNYLNAGVWPFIGGFYVVALTKMKKFDKAKKALDALAEANLKKIKIRDLDGEYPFNEWLHGKTGVAKGEPNQAWSAATYIWAYECVKKKKVIHF